jgi:hypothetical protein
MGKNMIAFLVTNGVCHIEAFRSGVEWLVKIEQENGFQDERENFQEAGVGAENPREPADDSTFSKEELPSYRQPKEVARDLSDVARNRRSLERF